MHVFLVFRPSLVGVHLFFVQAAYVVFHHTVAVGLYTAFINMVNVDVCGANLDKISEL